jgi:thiol-disulfide isomerase/thioredoxin
MKLKTLLIFLVLFNTNINLAQYSIKVNQKSPEIFVTDWIRNTPKDKILKDKYIVLEFWATWCGPCIEAVPHLNDLQAKFNRDDLYFISMTDEKIDRVERLLKKVNFKSIVVSDQTKKTHIAYGNGVTGLEAYPFTVLIDKSNTIKWIGSPKQLNDKVLEDFLNDKLIPFTLYEKAISNSSSEEIPKKSNYDFYSDLLFSKETTFAFEFWSNPNQLQNSLVSSKYYLYESESLKNILSTFLEINSNFIEIEPSLKDEQYFLFYVNKNQVSFNPTDAILEILNCNKREIQKRVNLNKVELVNPELLIEAPNENESGTSGAGNRVIYSAKLINEMINDVASRTKVIFELTLDEKYSTKTYDFIIDLTDEKSCLNSLKEYGFKINKAEEDKKFILIEKK